MDKSVYLDLYIYRYLYRDIKIEIGICLCISVSTIYMCFYYSCYIYLSLYNMCKSLYLYLPI